MKRIYTEIPEDIYGTAATNTSHVVIAVDPSGGGSSQFAVFSIAQLPNGSIMVRPASYPASLHPTCLPMSCTTPQTCRGIDNCA